MKTERAERRVQGRKEIEFMKRLLGGILLCVMSGSSGLWAAAQVSGEVEAGYQRTDVSANEAKYQEYGKPANGADIQSIWVNATTDSDTFHFEGHDLQQNNQSFDANYNRNYKMKVDASWDQIPHDYSNIGQTLYTQTAPGVLSLPNQMQSNIQSILASQTGSGSALTTKQNAVFISTFSSFLAGAQNADLQTMTDKGAVKLNFVPAEHVKLDLGFSEDRVEGNKPWGATFSTPGSGVLQLPLPVDYKTYNMRAGSQYNTKSVQFGVNYLMSSFNNNIEKLIWDNPKQLTATATVPGQGQESLAPDNWSHTITMNGGVNLPGKTRFAATGAMNYMRQNENLLPYTINSLALAATTAVNPSSATLPEQSANATIMTWTQDYALTNRIWEPLTLGLHFHSYQLINRTTEADFLSQDYTDAGLSTQPGGFVNNRYEYSRNTLEGSGDWQVLRPLSLGLKYGIEWYHQTDSAMADTTEKSLTATADFKPKPWTILRGSYLYAHRRPQSFDGGDYLAAGSTSTFDNPPGLRRYDASDRLRNQGRIIWQIDPEPVSIGLTASLTHDNFQPGDGTLNGSDIVAANASVPSTMYGLLETRDATAGIDTGWSVSRRLVLGAYYDYEQTKALQRNGSLTQLATGDRTLQSLDRYHTAGVNATVGSHTDRVTWRMAYDVVISRGSDDYESIGSLVTAPAVYPSVVPGVTDGVAGPTTPGILISPTDTKYMKQDISLRSNIRMTDHLGLILGYTFEKFDVTDWQNQNIPLVGGNASNSTNIYLGANLQNYVAHIGTILLKYIF